MNIVWRKRSYEVCTFSQSKTDFQFWKNALKKPNQTNLSDQANLVGAKTNSACKVRSVHKTLPKKSFGILHQLLTPGKNF